MADGDYQSYLRLLAGFFGEFGAVRRLGSQQPPRLGLNYIRAVLVYGSLSTYPNRRLQANGVFRCCNRIAMANMSLLLLTVTLAVPESTNVIEMGDDIVFMIGIALIVTKTAYLYLGTDEIDEVIEDFNYYENRFRPQSRPEQADCAAEEAEIRYWQRICYLAESYMFVILNVVMVLFNSAICVEPLISGRELPFHALFPRSWHHAAEHPRVHGLIYFWQFITSQYNLMVICHIDLLGIHTFLHTALNLKILCVELQKLGKQPLSDAGFHAEFRRLVQYHQHIMRTVDKNNRVFHGSFIAQMIASFTLISMSTFDMLAAQDDPKAATKFILFAVVTFSQLSYWCLAGTLVTTQSMKVAQAAFDVQDWHSKSISIQRNILFMIMRCQRPLIYEARPFPPFTMATYSMILQQCYRILALLRESM